MHQAKGILLTFAFTLAIQGCGIGTGLLSARLLGPQGKGELTAVILWPSVLATVFSLGLVDATIYFAGKEERDQIPLVFATSEGVLLLLALSAVFAGVLLIPKVLGHYSRDVVRTGLLYGVFFPLLSLAVLSPSALLQGTGRLRWYNVCRLLVPFVTLASMIGFWVSRMASVSTFAAASLIGNALALLVALVGVGRYRWIRLRFDTELARAMMTYGLKSHLGSVASVLNLRLDQMLISALLPPVQLGLYAVAVTYATSVIMISGSIAMAAFPFLLQAQREGVGSRTLAQFIRFNVLLTLPAVVPLMIGGHWLVPALFGSGFADAVPAALILLLASVPLSCNIVLSTGFKALGFPFQASKADLIGLILTFILLPLLLPVYQVKGAAIASLCAYSGTLVYLFWTARKCFGLSLTESLMPQAEDLADLLRIGWSIRLRGQPEPAKNVGYLHDD